MEIQSVAIPSVIEGYNLNLANVTKYELNGLKIQDNDADYIIGNLALAEGKNPHKAINSSVHETDYRLLMKTSLLIASKFVTDSMTVTSGFPHSTININKKAALDYIQNIDSVKFDTRPSGGKDYRTQPISIQKTDIISELSAADKAVRDNRDKKDENFFLVSLGYGTLEIGLSTPDGIIKRTENSASGIRYAINQTMSELNEKHYMGLRTEHQFDQAFQKGKIVINRQRIDFSEIRKKALQSYYKDVISPLIRNTWEDEDFNISDKIILVGGGSLYTDLVDCFDAEFDGFAEIELSENPTYMASIGYCIHSKVISGGNHSAAVGIDIGNAQTVISFYKRD
ncbi:MAG: hypothetical protein LAT67_15310 [Balneolales bacterium]|nr:hypothetical protein [Balneolales bacterium]